MHKLIVLIPFFLFGCSTEQQNFFDKVKEGKDLGATWHYVTPRSPDPKTSSLPLKYIDPETGEVYKEELILFKLR